MNNTPTEPTVTEIQERHDEDQADYEMVEHEASGMRNDPDCDFDVSYDGPDQYHIDRGILLERLAEEESNSKYDIEILYESVNHEMQRADKAQARLDAIGKLMRYKFSGLDYDLTAITESKSDGEWVKHTAIQAALKGD